jgi:hypothetical protein
MGRLNIRDRVAPLQAFFEEIHRSIALLPLFASQVYVDGSKISSTVVMSLTCGTPMIADDALLAAYPFIPKEATYYRPAGESEVDAMVRVLNMPQQDWFATRAKLLQAREKLRARNAVQLRKLFKLP